MLSFRSIVAVLLCLWSLSAVAFDVADGDGSRIQGSDIRYFFDTQGLSAEQVLASVDELPWKTPSSILLEPPQSSHPAWIMLRLQNNSPGAAFRLLELRWNNYPYVTFYQPDDISGELVTLTAGLSQNPEDRYRHNASILFPVILDAHESATILLKAETRYSFLLPLYLWEEQSFNEYQLWHHAVYAFLFGILSVMFVYNLLLWFFTRDNIYVFYSAYLLSVTLFVLASTGIGEHLIWGHSFWFRSHAYGFTAMLSFLAAALFVRKFLNLKQEGGWLLHLNSAVVLYWLVALPLYVTDITKASSLNELMSFFTTMAGLITSVYLAWLGRRPAIIFSIAWMAVIVGTVLYVLMLRGVLPFNNVTQYTQSIGFVVEVVLLSFALADRINQERHLRETAQHDLLRAQQEYSRNLEDRVSERTSELERTTQELKKANEELQILSVTDALTGLHNRRYFDDVLHQEIYRSHRLGQRLAMILVDIDYFKTFNDNYGHLVGDQCLVKVAAAMKSLFPREYDCVARYGGEEFAIILPGLHLDEAADKAEQVRVAISGLVVQYENQNLQVTASLGVTSVMASKDISNKDVTDMADKALYEAKAAGRNCVKTFHH